MGLLQFFEPFHLLVDRVGLQIQCLCASVDDQADWVVEFGDDLGDFEVHSSFDFLGSGSVDEEFFVDSKVVLGPAGDVALPKL